MGLADRRVKKGLTKVSTRLRELREELSVVDEQLAHLRDDADDLAMRALVSDYPGDKPDHRDAQNHVESMLKHRRHVLDEIAELERRQDELLDRLGG